MLTGSTGSSLNPTLPSRWFLPTTPLWKGSGAAVSVVTAQQQKPSELNSPGGPSAWDMKKASRRRKLSLLISCSTLPVAEGNNQTHGHGSGPSGPSRTHPSRCCSQAYFRPLLLLWLFFLLKMGEGACERSQAGLIIAAVDDSWPPGTHHPYLCVSVRFLSACSQEYLRKKVR